jgi:predicted permease
MQAERYRATGMSPEEASFAARRNFGGVDQIKEQARDQRGWGWLEQTWQDFRYAARALRKAPGYTFAVVATLAVGIGLVTAVVNVAQPILLPDLPFPEAERLVVLRERMTEGQGNYTVLLPYRFTSYAKHSTSFTALGAEKGDSLNLVAAGEPTAVRVSWVTDGFFPALGVGCETGRLFLPEEYDPARAGEVVVVSHAAWTKFFGQDPALIGKDIQLGERLRRVVGILPPEFRPGQLFRGDPDGIYLAAAYEAVPVRYTGGNVNAIGRLKPGVTIEQAEAELGTIHPEMPAGSGEFYTKLKPCLLSVADTFRESRATPFRIFLGAAGLLYLIGCTAVANLMLSRAVARRRELGVRLALGGSRRRIMSLVLAESLLLAFLAGVGGALAATWAQQAMTSLAPSGVSSAELMRHAHFGRTFGLALGLGVFTCVCSALVPAWRASRINLNEALKEGAGSLGDSRRLRFLRGTFVVVQGALAVALLTGAGLLFKTVYRLQHIDLGFTPEHKLVLSGNRRSAVDRGRPNSTDTAILERLAAVPGVASVALTTTVPAGGGGALTSVTTDSGGQPEKVTCFWFNVTPDYFETMQMPLLAGQGFARWHREDPPVAVIDEAMARQYFRDESPIGRFLVFGKTQREIVGVVRPVAVAYRGVPAGFSVGNTPITAQVYTPTWSSQPSQLPWLTAIMRLRQEPGSGFEASLRRAVFEVDPSMVLTITPLDDVLGRWSRTERQTLAMLQILSGLALGLAAFGMFSVTAYSVAQRRGELGVRLVLGATPAGLAALVLKRGLRLGGLGIVIGLMTAAVLSRFMQSILFKTNPHEPLVYVAVALVLLATTALACWLPARRAAKVNPVEALRAE